MSFSQLISIVLARKWIALWVLAITVLVTAVVSVLLPKTYTATASLVINTKGADPVTGLMLPTAMMAGYMGTQIDIIHSRNVARKVVERLGLTRNPTARLQFEKATKGVGDIQDWYADQFLEGLTVKPSRESSVVELSYRGADPKFAADLANAFSQAYIDTNLQLKIEPAKQASAWFDQQIKGLRLNVEKAQEKLSSYQQEHSIAFVDERLDTESARLSELSSQLVTAQAQTYSSNSRQDQLRKGGVDESQDVLSNSLIQGLKSQLAVAQAKLSDVSERLGTNHPQFKAFKAEVNNLERLISAETAKTSSSVSQVARASQQTESEIVAALAKQKELVLQLKSEHDEMAVLQREVESAQRVYDMALQRLGQTSMESQSVQTDVYVLNPATPPLKHSSPKVLINILLSVFLGGLLAIGFAVVAEMLDRRVRSTEDLIRFTDLALLADLSATKKSQPLFFRLLSMIKKTQFSGSKPLKHSLFVKS